MAGVRADAVSLDSEWSG